MLNRTFCILFFCLLAIFSSATSFAQCNRHDTTHLYDMAVSQPSGIGIYNNRIAVTSYRQDTFGGRAMVQVWDDRFLFTIGQPAVHTIELTSPEAVVFDASGNMYVMQTERPDSNIMIYNAALAFTGVIDNEDGPAHWSNPRGMAFDNPGELYVVSQDSTYTADTGTGPVTLTAPGTGKLIKIANPLTGAVKTVLLTGLYNPMAVAISGDNLYVSEYGANRVSRFSRSTLVRTDTITITHPVDLVSTGCILYCSEQGGHTVKVIQANDFGSGVVASLHQFDTLKSPSGIAVDVDYNLFISDNEHNRVVVFKAIDSVYSPPPVITIPIPEACSNVYVRLTDSVSAPGDVWINSDTLIAHVDTTGNVYTLTAGIDTIVHISGSDTFQHYLQVTNCSYDICQYNGTALPAAIPPGDSAATTNIWLSSDSTVVKVYGAGVVYGFNPGGVTIFHILGTDTIRFSVSVGGCPYNICKYTTADPSIFPPPDDLASPDVWYSSDTTIAQVYSPHVVYGWSPGTVLIFRVRGADTVSCVVTVTACTYAVCQYAYLEAGVSMPPSDPIFTPGTWYSDNPAIAPVDSNGLIYGALAGTANIFHVVNTDTISFPVTVHPIDTILPGRIYTLTDSGAVYDSFAMCINNVIQLLDTTTYGHWSISPAIAEIEQGDASVWPLESGLATVTFTHDYECNSVSRSFILRIDVPLDPGIITGPDSLCRGGSILLSDTTIGGTWSSSSAVVAISTAGLVSGTSGGNVTIFYTRSNGCGASQAVKAISVDTTSAGVIYGSVAVCIDSAITLTDSTAGGIWSIRDAHAGIAGGVVTGLSGGVDTVTYAVTATCGTAYAHYYITIDSAAPYPGIITGGDSICLGASVSLTDTVPSGIWTVANADAGVLGGVVTGTSAGTDTIFYTVANACGPNTAYKAINIIGQPDAGIISGTGGICAGTADSFTETVPGGFWISQDGNTAVSGGAVTGISAGTDIIIYVVSNSCFSDSALYPVVVYPAVPVPLISIAPPDAVCDNVMFQNFGTHIYPPANVTYNWTAENAVVWTTGVAGRNALVNFTTPSSTAVITLTAIDDSSGCHSVAVDTVSVSGTAADMPQVIYTYGQFICLQNDEVSYQWGYDDKATLDSTILTGEVNQGYINASPDPGKYYWVMVSRNGCLQKAYYQTPSTGIANINTGDVDVKVYPNPAAEIVYVELSTNVTGAITVEVTNLLGQKLSTAPAINDVATVNVGGLPAGTYLVNCYRDGIRLKTVELIKK